MTQTQTPPASPAAVPDARGRFGDFGGRYVPETLMFALDQLDRAYREAKHDPRVPRPSSTGSSTTTSAGRAGSTSPSG